MRITFISFIIVFGLSSFGWAQVSCPQVLSGQRAAQLEQGLDQIVSEQPAFPQLAASELLKSHFEELNQQIDHLLTTTRASINSGIQEKTENLSTLNQKILEHSQKIQKLLNPGTFGKWLQRKDAALLTSNGLIKDVAICRSRAETCAADLRPELQRLETYHKSLEEFAVTLQNEVQSLQDLLQKKEAFHSGVSEALIRQHESLVLANTTLKAQLQIHQSLMSAALSQLFLIEETLKNSIRMLMVTTPGGTELEKELLTLHEKSGPKFKSEVENFKVGTGVLFVNAVEDDRGFSELDFVDGTVFDIKDALTLAIRSNKAGMIFNRAVHDISVNEAAIVGCYHGICPGEAVKLPPGIWASDPGENLMVPRIINVQHFVTGYNPVTKRFLLRMQNGVYERSHIWVSSEDLVALKEGRLLPSLTEKLEDKTLKNGDIAFRIEKLDDQPQAVVGEVLIKGDQFFHVDLHSSKDRYGGYYDSRKTHPVQKSNLYKMSCAFGFCPGQVVDHQGRLVVIFGSDLKKQKVFVGNYYRGKNDDHSKLRGTRNWGMWVDPQSLKTVH